MNKNKPILLFATLLFFINYSFAQLESFEKYYLKNFLNTNVWNPHLINGNPIHLDEPVKEIVCEPIDDIFNLKCPRYQDEVIGNDYTEAIALAISDAQANSGGIVLFPGNTTVEIKSPITVHSNITFRASHSIATIKCNDAFTGNQIATLGNRQNITFEGIRFNANNKAFGIAAYGTTNSNINIINCVFENATKTGQQYSAIFMQNVTDLNIRNCVFKDSNFGISLSKRNTRIYIEDNRFEDTLDNSPIRIQGTQSGNEFSNHIWIRGNDFKIGKSYSIIDNHDGLTRNTTTGAVSGLNDIDGRPERTVNGVIIPADPDYNLQYWNWRNGNTKGHYAIDITCSSTAETSTYYHENIVIENNIAIGPDYGFFDGGSADLFGLKDIVRLKCVNNVARNSGDLGFAIVNCSGAIVSGNTADRNNSFGIAIVDTRNSVITGNILENNALRRDYLYNSSPYGGLLIAGGKSYNNIIESNHFFGFAPIDVSSDPYNSNSHTTLRHSPTDYYGIVIRASYNDTGGISYSNSPFLNKIGNNHYAGQKWGTIYNQVASTQINDDFSATTFPANRDYPLGTWIRNSNLNNSAFGWSVINRVETKLHSDWTVGDLYIEVDLTNSIQEQDIFGIMLDNGNVYWSIIDELIPQIDHYKIKLVQFPTSDLTLDIIDPAARRDNPYSMDRIVVLRWLAVTK